MRTGAICRRINGAKCSGLNSQQRLKSPIGRSVRCSATDKTVTKERRDLEGRSEIPNVEIKTDSRGRRQPAKKKRRTDDDLFARDVAASKQTATPSKRGASPAGNPITAAWDKASDGQRDQFLEACHLQRKRGRRAQNKPLVRMKRRRKGGWPKGKPRKPVVKESAA